jgi:serine/alanine adding enzyme
MRLMDSGITDAWDRYVNNHPRATLYHLSAWKSVITKTYGHSCHYLAAFRDSMGSIRCTALPVSALAENLSDKAAEPVGILPLVHLNSFLFGNSLVSIPFFDMGGILADNEEVERKLLSEAIRIGRDLKIDKLELRHLMPLSWISGNNQSPLRSEENFTVQTMSHKARMILELPDDPETLMSSFKAKLRSQIKKPMKEGLTANIGGMDLLDDFYDIFAANMRDLGSPVHSKKLMENVLSEFPHQAKIVVVYRQVKQPLAGSLIIGFRDTLENPWASALREYSALSPNMLLYWTMLDYACTHGYRYFDFGRSSPGEGSYIFKEQWGAKPTLLNWYYVAPDGTPLPSEADSDKARFQKLISCWQKLPVPVTKILGPRIRKHIGL